MLRKYKYAYKAMNCRIKLKLFVMETVNFWEDTFNLEIQVGNTRSTPLSDFPRL